MKFTTIPSKFLAGAVLVASLLLLNSSAQAQGPGSGGPEPTAPTAVPIDGGVSLLLAAGGALAVRRLRRFNKADN